MTTRIKARVSPRIQEAAGYIEPAYLRAPEYAARYGLGLNSVTNLVKAGRVDFFRVGRVLRILDAPPRPAGRE